ncbi:MAG: protein kinase [Syntrophales bacterium]|nr:protein kinase [Syntrophales bacterium]MDD5642891.1 protein kinase [Syntrophales bacterium]
MTIFREDDQESMEELEQRYELLHRLREEPWGEVWLATDRLLHTEIALKVLPRTDPDWDTGRKILVQEATLSLTLRHPLILGTFFLGEADDGLYLVEEAFKGESLISRLSRKQRFSVPETLRLLDQVAQALAFAHHRGVAHQTLNPLHVLLSDNEVRVANFASPARDDEQARHLELRAYTPPEVLRSEESSPAGNIFSLGVLGYRLLAGSLPYPLTFDEPFPYRLDPMPVDLEEIPLPLQNLLLQCLAPEPEDRLADAGDFLVQLRQLRESSSAEGLGTWLLEEPEQTPAAWRQFGSGAWGLWDKIRSLGRTWGEKLSTSRETTESPPAPTSRRLWWGVGLGGMLLVLVILVIQLQQPVKPPTEPPPLTGATATLSPPAAPGASVQPGSKAIPPLVESAEPGNQGEPLPVAKPAEPPGHRPSATLASPPAAAPPPPAKHTLKKERYLVLVSTFSRMDQAQALSRRLQGKKYRTRIIKIKVKGKPRYVVRLGPFTEKKTAEANLKRLQTREHLQPRLIVLKAKAAPATTARKVRR